MIKHIVMFRFKATESKTKQQNIEKAKEELLNLESKIEELESVEVGVNFNPSGQAYDLVLITTHTSKEDLDTYQGHSEHQKVVSFIKTILVERAVVDFLV